MSWEQFQETSDVPTTEGPQIKQTKIKSITETTKANSLLIKTIWQIQSPLWQWHVYNIKTAYGFHSASRFL